MTHTEITPPQEQTSAHAAASGRAFLRQAGLFVLVGVLLYLVLYVAADQLIYQYAKRNRFYDVKTAAAAPYDYVILGASHAAVFDYGDMNAQLEKLTGSKILNLSVVGTGPVVARVLLEYFLAGHQTKNVVYMLDSFAFNSADWNEKRFEDVALFARAPFDPALVRVLASDPASQGVAWDYMNGFARINNADRFKPDVSDDEAQKFAKTVYRPIKQIDQQRIDYLYPKDRDPQALAHYLGEFDKLLTSVEQRNIGLIVLKPPIPVRIYQMLPDEAKFDQAMKAILDKHKVKYYDFSLVDNDEKYYFNPDHLNAAGVLNFYDKHLKTVFTPGNAGTWTEPSGVPEVTAAAK